MTAIGDIEFLARLEGRVRVLRLLAERPHTRAELQAATDIPRATVGRIVTYFEERGLVTNGRHRKGCEASPLG